MTNAAKHYNLGLTSGVTLQLLYCAPGSFLMGSGDTEMGRDIDEYLHVVEIKKGFWLGRFPVTQAQWINIMGSCHAVFKNPDFPILNVSWCECMEFLMKAGAMLKCNLRLPTEAEWEYACRSGTLTAYSWGNSFDCEKVNCNGCHPCGTDLKGVSLGHPSTVGSYGCNAWGFSDMHGNVMEWCADWYDFEYSPRLNATGSFRMNEKRYRVLRGGSWASDAQDCRSAFRDRAEPDFKSQEIGFRICCDEPPHK